VKTRNSNAAFSIPVFTKRKTKTVPYGTSSGSGIKKKKLKKKKYPELKIPELEFWKKSLFSQNSSCSGILNFDHFEFREFRIFKNPELGP
jgi:hypothetical protein